MLVKKALHALENRVYDLQDFEKLLPAQTSLSGPIKPDYFLEYTMPTTIKIPLQKVINDQPEEYSAEAPTPTFKTTAETLLTTTKASYKDELFGFDSLNFFMPDSENSEKNMKNQYVTQISTLVQQYQKKEISTVAYLWSMLSIGEGKEPNSRFELCQQEKADELLKKIFPDFERVKHNLD